MLSCLAALQRLESLTTELADSHRELAQILAAEKECKVRTWVESQETTLGARERQGDSMALGLTVDAIRLKGEIAALEAERTYLLIIIEHIRDGS